MVEYLRKAQASRRKAASKQDGMNERKIMQVSLIAFRFAQRLDATILQAIDTTLAKLLSDSGEVDELLHLLASPNDCIVTEVEAFTDAEKHPYLKCQLLRMTGQKERLLQALAR